MSRTYKDVLKEKGFTWDNTEELYVKKAGFGRKITVDLMFKNLFIITSNRRKIHDNFIGSLQEFENVMKDL